ncbi:MAG TPA: hypothetical protein G4O13_08225 [Dehalococcoidia bacterium]|nr:hypothetical protein [Dehalococcoidia bacterium]
MQEIAYVIYWWLLLVFIGILSFPLVSRICGSLGDRGYSISKIVGILLITYFAWILASLHILPVGGTSILIAFLALAVLSLYFGRKNLNIKSWPRKQIIISELVFAVFFAIFIVFLMKSNDIHYFYGPTGDYFHKFAIFSSIERGGFLPPPDTWFAGDTLSYYYGGYLVMALLTIVTKVPGTISFNIAGAMFFALATTACYGLGYNITGRKLYGFLALLFVCILGYISGALELTAHLLHSPVLGYEPQWGPNYTDWFISFQSHLAGDTMIGEVAARYPYLKLLRWDMHSYVMSIPFQLMFLTLVFAVFQKGRSSNTIARADTLLDIFILSLSLGFFFLINVWDYPPYIILTLLAFILLKIRPNPKDNLTMIASVMIRPLALIPRKLRAWIEATITLTATIIFKFLHIPRRIAKGNIKGKIAVASGILAVPIAIVALSFLLFLPHYFSGGTESESTGIGIVRASIRTSLPEFIEFSSLFLFVILSLLFILWKREVLSKGLGAILISFTIIIATVLPSVFYDFQLLVVLVPVGLLALYCIYRAKTKSGMEFVMLIIVMAVLVAFAGELFFIKSPYGGPWARWQTIHKIYMTLWVFLSISAACGVFFVLNNPGRKRKITWTFMLVVLILACLVHPVATTTSAVHGNQLYMGLNPDTLDGMAYVENEDRGDYKAIRWINENINGHPVILEAPGNYGHYSSRVSTFTGLPTLLGWKGSISRPYEVLWSRVLDANEIYNTGNNSKALELLAKYDVKYVYIGNYERRTETREFSWDWAKQTYSSEGLGKFGEHPDDYALIYKNDSVSIYEVIERAQ